MITLRQAGILSGTAPLISIILKNVGVVGRTSTSYFLHVSMTESTVLVSGATTAPLLNNVCSSVFMPPIWSNSKKLIVRSVGRGVSKRLRKKVKSCKIAFGRPVVPVENNTNPA